MVKVFNCAAVASLYSARGLAARRVFYVNIINKMRHSSNTVKCSVVVQEFLASAANDSRRSSTKTPLAPPTKGLKGLMQKLGGINARHEALVRRVDELEVITPPSSSSSGTSSSSSAILHMKGWRRVVSLSNDHDLPLLQPLSSGTLCPQKTPQTLKRYSSKL